MLKAAAGGGGKGMRVVRTANELEAAWSGARAEAAGAFGDDRLYLERFLEAPRHIEVQVLADGRGRTIHLGERECSIQRRHQKLVEESPSPVIDQALRHRLGEVAVAAAEAVEYRGAGTVEFLFEEDAFYFLEMNTRLQVEHPVTELVTGVDLVREQLRIAAGEPLAIAVSPSWPTGHAIEVRISAEDPERDFLPTTGRIDGLWVPGGPGVRWDGGIAPGLEVGHFYDPLLAKLIAHADTRHEAIDRMSRALAELQISGICTTQSFHTRLMAEPDFRRGAMSIRYLEEHPEVAAPAVSESVAEVMVVAAALLEEERRQSPEPARRDRGGEPGAPGGVQLSEWQRRFAEP